MPYSKSLKGGAMRTRESKQRLNEPAVSFIFSILRHLSAQTDLRTHLSPRPGDAAKSPMHNRDRRCFGIPLPVASYVSNIDLRRMVTLGLLPAKAEESDAHAWMNAPVERKLDPIGQPSRCAAGTNSPR
jgi:hypothetical protein